MKRNELLELRELVAKEIKRRERIKELLDNYFVKEYLVMTKTKEVTLDTNIREVLDMLLANYSITKTNGIYVCTRSYNIDWRVCYEETNYYYQDTAINSKSAEHKTYVDIESGKSINAIKESTDGRNKPIISAFEQEYIVLNPYNTSKNDNGYNEVRLDFFETSLKDGQAKAKKMILAKYPIL